jgi:hypothetical protein
MMENTIPEIKKYLLNDLFFSRKAGRVTPDNPISAVRIISGWNTSKERPHNVIVPEICESVKQLLVELHPIVVRAVVGRETEFYYALDKKEVEDALNGLEDIVYYFKSVAESFARIIISPVKRNFEDAPVISIEELKKTVADAKKAKVK